MMVNARDEPERVPARRLPQGADLLRGGRGVSYRIWAPHATAVSVGIMASPDSNVPERQLRMQAEDGAYFQALDVMGGDGDLYRYSVDGGDWYPDPFSRWQPDGPFSASMVIDPNRYQWRVDSWQRRSLRNSVIYELHIGTFTSEGSFRSAIDKLEHIARLGATTLEIMPIAAFPGSRNWGYDGVMLFAPDASYGHPDDLRSLVDAAHRKDLNVILDVVYNHFGPDGNFLHVFSPFYFDASEQTPWGDAINFGGSHSEHVRAIYRSNVAYWMDEFRFDGFRLDATHAICDKSETHILRELADVVHRRGGILIAEDERNNAQLVLPRERGGMALDGVWADDFHHSVRVALTNDDQSYLRDFSGTPDELAKTIERGWYYIGQTSKVRNSSRGSPTDDIPLESFVHCVSNHDQVGNRAFGERLNHIVDLSAYRAATALACMTPSVPLLFMGQEWAADTPFQYFTDHHDALGRQVTEGRRREFRAFFASHGKPETEVPDPQDVATFRRSKLKWHECEQSAKSGILHLHAAALALRCHPAFVYRSRLTLTVAELPSNAIAFRLSVPKESSNHGDLLVLSNLWTHPAQPFVLANLPVARLAAGRHWTLVLASNEIRFGGTKTAIVRCGTIQFLLPETIVFEAATDE